MFNPKNDFDPLGLEEPTTIGKRLKGWITTPKGAVTFGAIAAVALAFVMLVVVPLLSPPVENPMKDPMQDPTNQPAMMKQIIHLVELDGAIDESRIEIIEYDTSIHGQHPSLNLMVGRTDIPGYTYIETVSGAAPRSATNLDLEWYDEDGNMINVVTDCYLNDALYQGGVGHMTLQVDYVDRATGNQLYAPLVMTGQNPGDHITAMAMRIQNYEPESVSLTARLCILPGSDDPYTNHLRIYYNPINPPPVDGPDLLDTPNVENVEATEAT